ncbi:MAG: acetoacetate--CoA ligase [Gammaproteobacteria bacterium]|nr:acetoacetate--CoA ligase [Gammaproteobacteria bacterium]
MIAAPLWTPGPARVGESNLRRFMAEASATCGRDFPDYQSLHAWSIEEPGEFWQQVWLFTKMCSSTPYPEPVNNVDAFPGARWFEGARLNYAEHLLRYRDDRPALVSLLETGQRRELSYAEVYRQTAHIATTLESFGIEPGDRVAGWLPNVPETIIAMLATASRGAVWSSCSPDFGVAGALDRFGQIEPKVLFACDGYYYNGKTISIVEKVREVADLVPSIQLIVWVSILGQTPSIGCTFGELIGDDTPDLQFVQRPFADPLFIMFSSGTTGKPKCIVHSLGGTLIQHLKEHQLHTDLKRNDKLFFFTTCGWMMWNWLASALATGATLILYDGSPFYPGPEQLLNIADNERISIFGVSARYLSALENLRLVPRDSHQLDDLRTILSTGSPLSAESFRYVYERFKQDVHLASISGGTDLISCFVLGNPLSPVWAGELQCAGLGMAVDVWDDNGQSVREQKGELVCTAAFPSCPIGFWKDANDEKFKHTYFQRFPGAWAQGDFAEITTNDGFIIHGRSDAVLNPGGVRIGTAEIYRQVEQIPEIMEAICVGQEWRDDTRVVLFVVLNAGFELTESLITTIENQIRRHASPRHVPAKVIQVSDIPRTLSGKIVELAVRDVIHDRPVINTSALANPEALEHFRDLEELLH